MMTLYLLLMLMLIVALGFLSIPLIKNRGLLPLLFFVTFLSLGLYSLSTNHSALTLWITQGQRHYQLQEQFNQLGGLEGAISTIQKKLAQDPTDAAGWFILGKLFLASQNKTQALIALKKAYDLKPADQEILKYYNAVNQRYLN